MLFGPGNHLSCSCAEDSETAQNHARNPADNQSVPSGSTGRVLLIWGWVRVRGELKSSVNSGERKTTSLGKFKPEVQV